VKSWKSRVRTYVWVLFFPRGDNRVKLRPALNRLAESFDLRDVGTGLHETRERIIVFAFKLPRHRNTHPLNLLLDTINNTVTEHFALVTRARTEHLAHESLLLSLQNQLEIHIGFIVANLESYIIVALQQSRIEATAQSTPRLTASSISTDTVPTSPQDTESGRFHFTQSAKDNKPASSTLGQSAIARPSGQPTNIAASTLLQKPLAYQLY
jgi:hypothetical protein